MRILILSLPFHGIEEIGKAIKLKETFHTVVIRSTVLPGTNKKVSDIIAETSGKENNIAFSTVSGTVLSSLLMFFSNSNTLIFSK